MIPVTSFKGKKVALFGLGGSGLVTARALVAGGADVVAFDDNPDSVAKAEAEGIKTADLRTIDWPSFSSFVLAPGVPLTHPKPHWSVDLAKAAGVEIIGDIELFIRERRAHAPDCPFIAITGTNGKSTTTALIAHILGASGRDTQLGGNIGTAVLSLDPPKAQRFYVVECSSYQIDLAPTINPTAGILLNLTPDHLDRHGTMQHYADVKERLVAGSQTAIVGVDDSHSTLIADRIERAGVKVERISKRNVVSEGFMPKAAASCGHMAARLRCSPISTVFRRFVAATMRRTRRRQSLPALRSAFPKTRFAPVSNPSPASSIACSRSDGAAMSPSSMTARRPTPMRQRPHFQVSTVSTGSPAVCRRRAVSPAFLRFSRASPRPI